MKTIVEHVANTAPAMEEVWVFVSQSDTGQENVMGANIGGLQMTPMITGNPKIFQMFRRIAAESRAELEARGQTIKLLHFSNRREIEKW